MSWVVLILGFAATIRLLKGGDLVFQRGCREGGGLWGWGAVGAGQGGKGEGIEYGDGST